MNDLEALKSMTVIVADTGDIDEIARVKPQDATTNPSLILKAASSAKFAKLLESAKGTPGDVTEKTDRLLVTFGCAILDVIPGRVSTEIDARCSFDTAASIARAKRIIKLYEAQGIDRSRVLIKIAATWEGVAAARELEKEGIHTNITLIFSPEQALIAAKAKVTLISPFVGRIYDWHKARAGKNWIEEDNAGAKDPGVQSVKAIYALLKSFGSKTQIMGASFRNKGEIIALAGCDLLTISPKLIDELRTSETGVTRVLDASNVAPAPEPEMTLESFVAALSNNPMAYEKLTTGIASFVTDTVKLEEML